MTFLRGLFESRSIQNPAVPLTASTLIDWLHSEGAGDSGVTVTETSALAFPALYRAVNLIAGTCASLPLEAIDSSRRNVTSLVFDQPHPELTKYEIAELWFVSMAMWGNSYSQKIRDGQGRLQELWPLPPSKVKVAIRPDARTADNPTGKVFRLGSDDRAYTKYDILHIPGFGYDGITGCSPIRMMSQGIGLGLAGEKYAAKLFGSGSLMSGILQTEQRLSQDQADRLKLNWRQKVAGLDKAHEVAVLDSGAKFQSISIPPIDSQMIENRKFQVVELARAYGIPPHLLGDVERSTSWGSGIEQQSIGFVVYTLRPWLTRVEARLSREVLPGSTFARFKVDELMRGDAVGRAQYYTQMRNMGVLSVNEIRQREDMVALPGDAGDTYLQPMNMTPLGKTSNPEAVPAADAPAAIES